MAVYQLNEGYDFSKLKTEEELNQFYIDEIDSILKDWNTKGKPGYWSSWGVTVEFPLYLRQVANELESLGNAYFNRMDNIDETSWVFEETPIDKIIDIYKDRDFIEVTGKAGGDTLTFRKYNNGMIAER